MADKGSSTWKSPLALSGIGLGGLGLLILPHLMPSEYHRQVINLAAIYVILVVGYNFPVGFTGQLSFAQTGFFAIGAYTSALLTVKTGLSFWLALPLAGVLAGLFGGVVGIPTIKIKGHYLAMVTIAFSEVIRIVLTNWQRVTGGGQGIMKIPPPGLGPVRLDTKASFYYLLLAMTLLSLLVAYRVHRSKYGRMFQAVRDSELAAEVMGINSTRTKAMAFILSAMYGGMAGSLFAHSYAYISPEIFSMGQSVIILAMLLIGGVGTIPGAIVGAIVLTLLPEYLRFVKEYYMFTFGIGIFVITLFCPGGLVGLYSSVRGQLKRKLVHMRKG